MLNCGSYLTVVNSVCCCLISVLTPKTLRNAVDYCLFWCCCIFFSTSLCSSSRTYCLALNLCSNFSFSFSASNLSFSLWANFSFFLFSIRWFLLRIGSSASIICFLPIVYYKCWKIEESTLNVVRIVSFISQLFDTTNKTICSSLTNVSNLMDLVRR